MQSATERSFYNPPHPTRDGTMAEQNPRGFFDSPGIFQRFQKKATAILIGT